MDSWPQWPQRHTADSDPHRKDVQCSWDKWSHPHHQCQRAGSAPYLWGMVPAARTEQLSNHPGTHPGLSVGTLHCLIHLWSAAVHEGTGPVETQGNSRTYERRFSECPVLMVSQKPEALNLSSTTIYNEYLQVKLFKQKGIGHDTRLPVPLSWVKRWWRVRERLIFIFYSYHFLLSFSLRETLQGWRADMEDWEMDESGVYYMKFPKNIFLKIILK